MEVIAEIIVIVAGLLTGFYLSIKYGDYNKD